MALLCDFSELVKWKRKYYQVICSMKNNYFLNNYKTNVLNFISKVKSFPTLFSSHSSI
uniref:Uncharacterized protein n=1 Tax=Heterorhabditis bacteriophora TaxID=37862 RepID=A0A1I7WF48_HETBA